MELFYDLHIHSCLSPCGAEDMTPNNIVNMAALAGLNVIAVADHNSTRNCAAVLHAGEAAGILVVPAMELTTQEEVHVLCLFPDLDAANGFCDLVYEKLPSVKNKPRAFGHQWIMDENDEIMAEEEHLLSGAAAIGIYEVPKLISGFGGLAVPAHIDRASFSLLSNLGFADPEMGFSVYETTPGCDRANLIEQHMLEGCGFFYSSDAHDLIAIADASTSISVSEATAGSVISAIAALREK